MAPAARIFAAFQLQASFLEARLNHDPAPRESMPIASFI
jgi:hypothetical protein